MNEREFKMMKKSILLLLIGLAGFTQAQEIPAIIDRISQKFAACQQVYPAEKIFLQTDKEIYAPGEIIWFSGYVINRSSGNFSVYYQDIAVAVYDNSGNLVAGDKYPVTQGKITGDILLPENLPLGNYFLAAFTLYQEEPDNLYIKPIIIHRFYRSDAQIALAVPGEVFKAGTKADIDLKVFDFAGDPVDKFSMKYEIRHQDKILNEGKIRSVNGKVTIQALLPEKTGNDPVELVVSHPKNLWMHKLLLKTTTDELSVKFYPEGGNLVGTLSQKTGFHATVWRNTPVDMEADITNNSGQVVAKVKSLYPGSGIFRLQPEPDEKYRLIVTSEYGRGQSFDLPKVKEANGLALILSGMDDENITADLMFNGSQPQNLIVTASRCYQLLWAAKLDISENARIKIPVEPLGSGIVRLSVFNDAEELLSSRLVFLPETKKASLRISDAVAGDGKLKLSLTSVDETGKPSPAGIIISIADTTRKSLRSGILQEQFFLSGDLQNPVEGTAFSAEEYGSGNTAFDYLMLCNEIKGCTWERVMKVKEKNVDEVHFGYSGRVTDKKGNPVPYADVKILDNRDMKMYNAVADDKGYFRYAEYQPLRMSDLTISATDKVGKGNFSVQADPTITDKVGTLIRTHHFFPDEKSLSGQVMAGYLKTNPGQLFEEPTVKIPVENDKKQRVEPYKTLLSTASNLLDVIRSIKPFSIMNGQIVFSGTVNSFNFQSGALIVLDGVKLGTSADLLNNIVPYDVDEIRVSTDPMDIQKYTGLNNVGVIEITTKRGVAVSPSAVSTLPKEELYKDGLRIPRVFLSTNALSGRSGKDYRTTLYWNPDLSTGPSGSTTFSIPLSDIKSGFVITAAGITTSGKIIEAVRQFSVP